jgi:hypothetical protein
VLHLVGALGGEEGRRERRRFAAPAGEPGGVAGVLTALV